MRVRWALPVLAPVLVVTTTASWWLRFDVMPPDAMGHHVRQAVQQPAVREELGGRMARAVAERDPRAAAAEPLIRSAAEIVIESRQFGDVLDVAVQVTRRAVVHGRQSDANRLEDLEEQLVGVLETLNPEVADRVPRDWDTRLVDLRPDGKLARSLRAADTLARYWLVLAVATATWHLLWILSSADRHRTLTRAAFLSLFAGSMILAAASFGRIAVGHGFDSGTAAAIRATYDEFAGGAKSTAYAIVASSVVVIAASTAGLPGLRTAGVLRWVVRVVRLPRNPIGQVCVAVASASAGTLLVAIAPAIAVMLVRLLGVTLAYLGVGLIARSLPEAEPAALGATRRYSRRYLVGVVATAVIAVPGLVWARSARTAAAGDSDLRCNGSADLCDRRVDQVAFAGAHNAMASPEAGFLLASQTGTIAAQLRGGIRALLLDSTYGIATSTGVVWTDATTLDVQSQLADRLDPDTLATAESLRKNLLPPARDPDVYLCHAACEIGATLAVDAFRDVRLFLEQNPSEIVLLILQDSTSDSDTIGAIRRARLDQFAYTHEAGDPWPTLAQLIRQATPLIVMSERHGDHGSWFHPAFESMSDTPYDSPSVSDLSCELNRGAPDNDLLLLNAWVNEPLPSRATAREVNDKVNLTGYAERCQKERGQTVNIVAANFWQEGDLIQAVANLNGLDNP